MLEKDSNSSRHDVERVVDVVVVMAGHLLRRADLKLGDAKSWTHRVIGATLYLVERARIRHSLHGASSALFDCLDVRVADDLCPPCYFGLDLGLKLFGGADGDRESDRSQARPHLRARQNFIDLSIKLVDDLFGRPSRSDQASEDHRLLTRRPTLPQCPHIRKSRRTRATR